MDIVSVQYDNRHNTQAIYLEKKNHCWLWTQTEQIFVKWEIEGCACDQAKHNFGICNISISKQIYN